MKTATTLLCLSLLAVAACTTEIADTDPDNLEGIPAGLIVEPVELIEIDRMGESCAVYGDAASCLGDGVQFCSPMGGGMEWGPCMDFVECEPGDRRDCQGGEWGDEVCRVFGGVPDWDTSSCGDDGGESTPLVLELDGTPTQFETSSVPFDIVGDGACVANDWPTAQTPWLAIDLDRDGTVDSGRELFGSGTLLETGALAQNGFEALAEYDTNADGWVTAADARYHELVAWSDHDGDRVGSLSELTPIADLGITALQVSYDIDPLCDARGNCAIERASVKMGDRSGRVVDVHLPCR